MSTNDDPRPEDEWVTPPQAAPAPPGEPAPPARTSTRYRRAGQIAAFLAAGVLVGGGASFVLHHNSGATASAGNAAASFGVPQGSDGAGTFRGGPPGGGGPVAGEQHVQGTVTATTASTVTVKSSSGTATYTVNATTEIVRNGQASTLSAVKVGDPVLVHVFPSQSGDMLVERLFAGSSASDTGPPGLGPPDSDGSQSTAPTT